MTTCQAALAAATRTAVLACALVLSGCGGGGSSSTTNNTGFTSMVSYGDSLSDVGTYKVGAIAAVGGGQWTVNSPGVKNWTELIAAQYGLPAPCAAQTGLLSIIPGIAAVAVQDFAACRNYAQGSSRITSPAGPNSVAIQQGVLAATGSAAAATQAAGLGLMAVPVVNQMATHLGRVGGSYGGKELVTVFAGANDVFLNLNGVSSAAGGGAGAVGAAQFAGWSPVVQGAVAAGGAAAVSAASQAAVAGMAQAGNELAAAIETQVLAKGAKYVVVVSVPDIAQTPFAMALDAGSRSLINQLVTTFNSTVKQALAGKPGVLLVDAYTQGRDQFANPAQYALSNVSTPACSNTSAANPLAGSSLACSNASTIAGDTSRYLFSDDVHPTPYAYLLLAQFVTQHLATAGWL